MTSIHIYPQAAGQAGNALKRDKDVPVREQTDEPQRPDEEMMYAWSTPPAPSIGVTEAAREIAQAPRREECPPEVYIG